MIQFFMLVAVWVATGACFFLLVPQENWNGQFYLTVATIVLAETLLFTKGVLRRAAAFGSAASEADSGLTLVNMVYSAAIAVLAIVNFTARPELKTLGVCHILAGLLLLLGWGTMAKARNRLAAMDRGSGPAEEP